VRVSGKADRAEGFLRLRDTDTSLTAFREKQLSLAQAILLPTKKSRHSKQEEKKRNFTTRRWCVCASAAAENTHYKIIRSCRFGSRQLKGAAAPSASTTPSARSDLASDGDAVGESPPLRLPTHPAWRPRPTRHATGAPVATCKQLHRHPHHYHASSTTEPVPRLKATLRTTQQCQPGATVNTAKNGPAVMAVAGGQEQWSRRQPNSRPIQGQREKPLSRREEGAPVFRSSNGSRTRNGRPANRSPRRINSAAGQAAPLLGEVSDASPFTIMTASKKVRHVIQFRILFLFLFLSLTTGTGKGGYPEKDPSP
jgi:hypothetical protein